jgi:hypothetical protein
MAIDKEKNKQVWAVLTNEEYEDLKQLSEEQERSMSKQAAFIIKLYLKMWKQ